MTTNNSTFTDGLELRKFLVLETKGENPNEDAFELLLKITNSTALEFNIPWIADDLPSNQNNATTIPGRPTLKLTHIHSKKATQLLGTSNPVVCYIACPLNANIVAAAAGSIPSGGLLVLAIDHHQAQSNYFRFMREQLYRTVSKNGFQTLCWVIKQNGGFYNQIGVKGSELLDNKTTRSLAAGLGYSAGLALSVPVRPTEQQEAFIVSAICHLQTPSSNVNGSAILLQARRGRGKSVALAFFINSWLAASAENSVLFASPSRKQAMPVLQIVQQNNPLTAKRFSFLSVDDLIAKKKDRAQKISGENQILIIDEAASISTALLQSASGTATHLVLSTTTEGYEGSGQGFLSRYIKEIRERFVNFKAYTLEQPLRWSAEDELEPIVDDICGLNWKKASFLAVDHQSRRQRPSEEIRIFKIAADDLLDNLTLLRQVIELLVDGHYRTRPSDLQQLLDGTSAQGDRHLWIATVAEGAQNASSKLQGKPSDTVIGVLLAIEEGYDLAAPQHAEVNKDLAFQVASGRRRPPGNLVAQKLASHFCQTAWLSLGSLRVSRVAVTEAYRRSGVASRLIGQLEEHAQQTNLAYWSSSFGDTTSINRFWDSLGVEKVYSGFKIDSASGTNTAIVAKAIIGMRAARSDTEAKRLISFARRSFIYDQRELSKVASHPISGVDAVSEAETGPMKYTADFHKLDLQRVARLAAGRMDIDSASASLRRYLNAQDPLETIGNKLNISAAHFIQLMDQFAPDWSGLAKSVSLSGRGELLRLTMDYLKIKLNETGGLDAEPLC